VRAANTGISVVTDAHGRALARLGLNEAGVLDARIPGALPEPSFARRQEGWLLPMLLAAALVLSFLVEIWRRRLA
jgi:apolipoprotein N-acyltransferase